MIKLLPVSHSILTCNCRISISNFDPSIIMDRLEPLVSDTIPVFRCEITEYKNRQPRRYIREIIKDGYDHIIKKYPIKELRNGKNIVVGYRRAKCMGSQITFYILSDEFPNYYYPVKVYKSNGTVQIPGIKYEDYRDVNYVMEQLIKVLNIAFEMTETPIQRIPFDSGKYKIVIVRNAIGGIPDRKYSIILDRLSDYLNTHLDGGITDSPITVISPSMLNINGLAVNVKSRDINYGKYGEKKKNAKFNIYSTGKFQLYRCEHDLEREQAVHWISQMFNYVYANIPDIIIKSADR